MPDEKKEKKKQVVKRPELTSKQRRALRALGHHLDPVVQTGKNGVDAPQFEAMEQALLTHELIKVRISKKSPIDLEEMVELVEKNTLAACVQKIGRIALFYKPHPEKPKIVLP